MQQTNTADPAGARRTTRAEAARILGVNRSTVGRWVKEKPELIDAAGLVDPEELREFEATTKHPANQTRRSPAMVQGDARQSATVIGLNDHRARREVARASREELDLADRMKLTLRRSEVESAIAEAAELMRQAAGQLVRDHAEPLALIDDSRAMERALEDLVHQLLEAAARSLEQAAGAGVDTDEA